MAAGKGLDEARHIFLAAHGQRRHLQPGNPTLGAGFQGGNVGGGEIETHDLVKENGRFLSRKAQIRRTQLSKLAAHPQASQR